MERQVPLPDDINERKKEFVELRQQVLNMQLELKEKNKRFKALKAYFLEVLEQQHEVDPRFVAIRLKEHGITLKLQDKKVAIKPKEDDIKRRLLLYFRNDAATARACWEDVYERREKEQRISLAIVDENKNKRKKANKSEVF